MMNVKNAKDIGESLTLFFMNPKFPGQITFLPKGVIMLNKLKKLIQNIYINDLNLLEVSSATLGSQELYDSTGHNTHYKSNIFSVADTNLSIKPMNCPMHLEIMRKLYKRQSVLPIGLFEFNYCFRNEASGSLGSVFRLTRFTQDDAHVLTKLDHMESYIEKFLTNALLVYKQFNLSIHLRFSKTDSEYIGSDIYRKRSEDIIQALLTRKFADYSVSNDGAFYGPKIDIIAKDMQDRSWQLGTIQVDLNTLGRIGFTMQNNDKIEDYGILHHALLGTFERFLGVILENAGGIPELINPYDTIVIILQSNEKNSEVNNYYQELKQSVSVVAVDFDISHDSIQNKIKSAHAFNYNHIFICGPKEAKDRVLSTHKTTLDIAQILSFNTFVQMYQK